MYSNRLSFRETNRFQKQISLPEIGEQGQLKLKHSSVLVFGAGQIGSPVLQYLVASGIGKIGIVDDGKIEDQDLQCQLLYGMKDIGKHKVIIATQKLSTKSPYVDITIINIKLTDDNARGMIRDYDVIVDSTNKISDHYIIDDACLHENKTWIYGSIIRYSGKVTVFNYSKGLTYRDVYPESPVKEEIQDSNKQGVISVLPGLICGLMAAEVIKFLVGFGDVLSGKMLSIDLQKNKFQILTV